MFRTLLPLFVFGLTCFSAGQAHALFDGDLLRIYALGDLGVGGSIYNKDKDTDLRPTYGFSAGADLGVHDFVAVGAMVGWSSLQLDHDAFAGIGKGRSTILDLAVFPRLRIPLPLVEPYVMTPVGYANFNPSGTKSESGTSLGLTAGAGLSLLPLVKITGEVGYQMYFFQNVDIQELRFRLGLAVGF